MARSENGEACVSGVVTKAGKACFGGEDGSLGAVVESLIGLELEGVFARRGLPVSKGDFNPCVTIQFAGEVGVAAAMRKHASYPMLHSIDQIIILFAIRQLQVIPQIFYSTSQFKMLMLLIYTYTPCVDYSPYCTNQMCSLVLSCV